jgi:alpha-L-fucosidase
VTVLFTIITNAVAGQSPKAVPVPSKQQLAWHNMEYYWFIHFGPNTFTDKEWGQGDEQAVFLTQHNWNCRQWARIAKQAGAKGIILHNQTSRWILSLAKQIFYSYYKGK